MKISIITVTLNSAKTIEDTIRSVIDQNYPNIEYIIIDGGSTDGTLDILNKYKDSDTNKNFSARRINKIVSEKDNSMYEAMNKGLRLATGDIIGILNSDDVYASNNVVKIVTDEFKKSNADCVWGDLVYVDKDDPNKVVRNWKSSPYEEGSFQKGWHPPHPTFFVRRKIYEQYGLFRTDLSTSADYELMLRFLEKYKTTSSYALHIFVRMRSGGQSNRTYANWIKANLGCYKAFKINGLKIDPFFIIRKPLFKLGQFFT
jgi:glycosyltransferase